MSCSWNRNIVSDPNSSRTRTSNNNNNKKLLRNLIVL